MSSITRIPIPIRIKIEPTATAIIQFRAGACDVSRITAKATSETPINIKEMAATLRGLNAIRGGHLLERFKVP